MSLRRLQGMSSKYLQDMSLKLGSHQAINPDSIAKLTINQKLSPKSQQNYFGVNVKAIKNYRPYHVFKNYRQFSKR